MIIDMHIHSRSSDGAFTVNEIFKEARLRNIEFLSITDHDSIECQELAIDLAETTGIRYVSGVELNVAFSYPKYHQGKPIALDFLGYQFDVKNKTLATKLGQIAQYREERAAEILRNLNAEFEKEGIEKLSKCDFKEIQASVDGTLGRPHIADYLVRKGIVKSKQEAFARYLVKCNVPKYPLHLEEASKLIRNAGGKMILAHPNDPYGTSLTTLTTSLTEQTAVIKNSMLSYIDGVECWHSRNDVQTTDHYVKFAEEQRFLMTGGSDCHQKPVTMGDVKIPEYVVDQFFLN